MLYFENYALMLFVSFVFTLKNSECIIATLNFKQMKPHICKLIVNTFIFEEFKT